MSDAKILVVEDEQSMANALKLKLTNEGFDVEVANNGEEALKKIETGSFALVLLDLVMPKVDGFKVLETVKDMDIEPPTIIVSSNLSQTEEFQRAKELGAEDYYVKSNTSLSKILDLVRMHTS